MSSSYRRHVFVEDEGLAFLADLEAGSLGKKVMFSTSPSCNGGKALISSAPASTESPQHFLDSCALCNKSLRGNSDIFMYRGNTPFCSEGCRQEQIDLDEAKEKRSSYKEVPLRKEHNSNNSSKGQNQDFYARAGSVLAR